MKVAIIQSNYIPWKGYFDIIHEVDLFLFFDDVQFTVRDWRNRNQVKTNNGPLWLTVPVTSGSRDKLIRDVEIGDTDWASNHLKTLTHYYGKAPHFARYRDFLQEVYGTRRWTSLSELNQYITTTIAREFLGITTRFESAEAYGAQGQKHDRIFDLLAKVGATSYLSGPAARSYIDAAAYEAAGIELCYQDYAGYPEYAQFHPPFTHGVSILDLLFHTGPAAADHIWGWRERPATAPATLEPTTPR